MAGPETIEGTIRETAGSLDPAEPNASPKDWVARFGARDRSGHRSTVQCMPGAGAAMAAGEHATVVFAGALHNRGQLTERFGASRYEPSSDAELVLAGLSLRGRGALDDLRGRYAVAVLEHRTGTLLLARDPMGMHPLFYAEAGDGDLLVSSSIDALRRLQRGEPADGPGAARAALDRPGRDLQPGGAARSPRAPAHRRPRGANRAALLGPASGRTR